MKKIIVSIIVLISLALKPLEATSAKVGTVYTVDHAHKFNCITRKYYIQTEARAVLDALTVYNPTMRQCDRSPLVTASNSRIDKVKLGNQKIRWMALSRNLLKRWNGKFHYGDTVMVNSGDPSIDGFWVIKDTMNKRYRNYGDLLFHSNIRSTGKWRKVEITRVKSITLSL
ncbi:MAG TPA: hypothetical protein VFU05_05625 [Cyclobacteriaceae bacterium]|nr:hypothetical protein [Cyclobacteriaceae bacterium]